MQPAAADAASATTPAVVLEAHVGERTSVAGIATVLAELEQCGLATRPASIIKLLQGRAPRPGILDADASAASILALGRSGFEAFTRTEYKEAAATLALAVHQIKRNPALLVLDAGNVRTMFRAFVGLALSQAKLGYTAESLETMTELLRSFATQTVSRAEYGPQAEQLYRSVQKQTEALGRGDLAIAVDDANAMIFVNSEFRGMGSVSLAALIPGSYRVFVYVPGSNGRQYAIDVRPGERSTLEIEWQIDAALTASEAWFGFSFASEAERDRALDHAAALARRWNHRAIVVIEAVRFQDTASVRGTMYGGDGRVIRSAVVVDDGDAGKLRALGRFLSDGISSRGLLRVVGPPRASSAERGPALPAWPFIAGGVLALGVGVGLLAIDQDRGYTRADGVRPAYYRDTAPFGVAAGVAGVVSLGFGIWWWTRTHSSAPRLVPTTAMSGGAASPIIVGVRGSF